MHSLPSTLAGSEQVFPGSDLGGLASPALLVDEAHPAGAQVVPDPIGLCEVEFPPGLVAQLQVVLDLGGLHPAGVEFQVAHDHAVFGVAGRDRGQGRQGGHGHTDAHAHVDVHGVGLRVLVHAHAHVHARAGAHIHAHALVLDIVVPIASIIPVGAYLALLDF